MTAGKKQGFEVILGDRVLLALLRIKRVPVSFLLHRAAKPFTTQSAVELIDYLNKEGMIGDVDGDDRSSTSVVQKVVLNSKPKSVSASASIKKTEVQEEAEKPFVNSYSNAPQYTIVKKALHIVSGINKTKSHDEYFTGELAKEILKSKAISIQTDARQLASDFNRQIYQPFATQYVEYEAFLRVCDKKLNIQEALEHVNLGADEWKKLRATISRYGLGRDVHFAKMAEIKKELYSYVEEQFAPQRMPTIAANALKQFLASESVAVPRYRPKILASASKVKGVKIGGDLVTEVERRFLGHHIDVIVKAALLSMLVSQGIPIDRFSN